MQFRSNPTTLQTQRKPPHPHPSSPNLQDNSSTAARILKFTTLQKQNIQEYQSFQMSGRDNKKIRPLHREMSFQHTTSSKKKKFIYDEETMRDMLLMLKEENNQLREIIRIQNTQLGYFEEQEKNILQTATCVAPNIKKLQIQNFNLRKQLQNTKWEFQKLKKSLKTTNIKELESVIVVYEEQIKFLTAKLLGFEKSSKNLQEINNIIQRDYMNSVRIKELEGLLQQKIENLDQSGKIIRKLRTIISQKNLQHQHLSSQNQSLLQTSLRSKPKPPQQFCISKSEYLSKKKQILSLSQMIQKLQKKLIECQNKIQSLQQQNIQQINQEILKRQQLVRECQGFRKKCEKLEDGLREAIRNRDHGVAKKEKEKEGRKLKVPGVVKVDNLKHVLEHIIFNLQLQQIPQKTAPVHIQQTQPVPPSTLPEISLLHLLNILQDPPFNITQYQDRQLLGRYLIEQQNSDNIDQYIDFDISASLVYVRAIFKQVLKDYPVFGRQQEYACCGAVLEVLMANQHRIKANFQKISTIQPINYLSYLDWLTTSTQLSEYQLQFTKYWIFKNTINKYNQSQPTPTPSIKMRRIEENIQFSQFVRLFVVDNSGCTFLTEETACGRELGGR